MARKSWPLIYKWRVPESRANVNAVTTPDKGDPRRPDDQSLTRAGDRCRRRRDANATDAEPWPQHTSLRLGWGAAYRIASWLLRFCTTALYCPYVRIAF